MQGCTSAPSIGSSPICTRTPAARRSSAASSLVAGRQCSWGSPPVAVKIGRPSSSCPVATSCAAASPRGADGGRVPVLRGLGVGTGATRRRVLTALPRNGGGRKSSRRGGGLAGGGLLLGEP